MLTHTLFPSQWKAFPHSFRSLFLSFLVLETNILFNIHINNHAIHSHCFCIKVVRTKFWSQTSLELGVVDCLQQACLICGQQAVCIPAYLWMWLNTFVDDKVDFSVKRLDNLGLEVQTDLIKMTSPHLTALLDNFLCNKIDVIDANLNGIYRNVRFGYELAMSFSFL